MIQIDISKEEYGNPYRVMYRWINIEIQDLMAMKDCTSSIIKIEKIIREKKSEVIDLREYRTSLIEDKITVKGLWAKITGKTVTEEQVAAQIVALEAEIEDWS